MPQHVLLVDDDPELLSSLQRSLHRESYQIRCATSAQEAFAILESGPVDLIISDQEMPGMKGTEFLAKVRERSPEIVRFILTGKPTLDTALEAINKGEISRFFVKPCSMIELTVAIRQGLQQKQLLCMAKGLLQKVKQQSTALDKIESECPGITKVHRDAMGTIMLDDTPEDFESIVNEVNKILPVSDRS